MTTAMEILVSEAAEEELEFSPVLFSDTRSVVKIRNSKFKMDNI